MKTLKAVAARYNATSLILRIVIGLVVGAVLALAVPGAGWVEEFGSLFVGALEGHCPGAGVHYRGQCAGAGHVQAGPALWHGHLAVHAHHLPGRRHCGGDQLPVPSDHRSGRGGRIRGGAPGSGRG